MLTTCAQSGNTLGTESEKRLRARHLYWKRFLQHVFHKLANVGFVARPPYTSTKFRKQVYPGAENTVVTSINNMNTIAGWYQNPEGGIYGFTEWQGIWTKYQDNHELHGGSAQVTKLLGISDGSLAVGYYVESGADHATYLNLTTGKFKDIHVPNATGSAATGINGKGDICGWLTLASGVTEGWLLKGGQFTMFQYPGGNGTQPSALEWSDSIAGSYEDASGNTHGFVLTDPLSSQVWTEVDDPTAKGGETVVTGINNHYTLTGYYQAPDGSINGFLATAKGSGN